MPYRCMHAAQERVGNVGDLLSCPLTNLWGEPSGNGSLAGLGLLELQLDDRLVAVTVPPCYLIVVLALAIGVKDGDASVGSHSRRCICACSHLFGLIRRGQARSISRCVFGCDCRSEPRGVELDLAQSSPHRLGWRRQMVKLCIVEPVGPRGQDKSRLLSEKRLEPLFVPAGDVRTVLVQPELDPQGQIVHKA